MNEGRTIFSQLLEHAPHHHFRRCVERYRGNLGLRRFRCWDQFLCMVFAQLTYRESLRDIEACLGAVPDRLYHMGIRSVVSRSTLADANEKRNWRIYADFAQVLILEARRLYAGDSSAQIWRRPSTPSTPPRSACACRSFPGRTSDAPRARSSFTPCSTSGAVSRRS